LGVALVIVSLLLGLQDVESFREIRIVSSVHICIGPKIKLIVGRGFLSSAFLVLYFRQFDFIEWHFLLWLCDCLIDFLVRFLVFSLLLFHDLFIDLLFQFEILLHFFPLLLLFSAFGLLHLNAEFFLVLVLFPGLAFCLLGIGDEQSSSESSLVAYCDFCVSE
jgi:hypothetical protein